MSNPTGFILKPFGHSRMRHGATLIESAILLPIFLLTIFAILDLGIATLRYNALSEVTRRIAREAILRGSLTPHPNGSWGPVGYEGSMDSGVEIVAVAKDMTPTMNKRDVTIRITWPDEDNAPRDRVQVEASYDHQPLVPLICPWGTLPLRSVATMHIVN